MRFRWPTTLTSAHMFFFFFQAEDGIRDYKVTGVQTCALPICYGRRQPTSCKIHFHGIMVRLASIAAISWPNLSWEASAPWIRKLSSASLNACGSTFGPAVDGITAVAGGGADGLAAR